MKSQEGNAATVLPSTPTHGVRKIVIRFKIPTKNTNTMILNSETSCFPNAKNMNGKRVLDMECKNEFQENNKKAKRQTDTRNHVKDVATTSTTLYKPTETRYNEIKKPTDAVKKGKVFVEKRKKLLMSFVNSEGKPACPLCRVNFVSNKFLYQHMALHSDNDWKTFIRTLDTADVTRSGDNHNHDAKVVNLSKCLYGWDVKTGKRGRLGSTVADVKVNKVPNAKYYLGLGPFDLGEVDEDIQEAAKILVLMARDHQLKSKTSMAIQREEEAAKCLMCLDDPVTPPRVEYGTQVEGLITTSMTDRNLQVEESADTISGEIKEVRGFDLNELPAFEDVVNLSKCLYGWDVKTGKRGRLGSTVADVKVNKVPNAKYYLGLGPFDLGEVDEDIQEAAKILVLMARDHQLKSKTSMAIQREEEAAKCLMCLDDPVTPPRVEYGTQVEGLITTSMTDRNLQVEESADTISGEIKGVRGFDLNELPAFEDVSLTE
ncbi:zinc finger C2H2-type/integrase DNA-binding domain-containing protein [Artemisia annua]|uniref:Zinc finger C2H2-type/integrase DNA-binding domain-containing protein n=1 Tax=Artemisia annua TaxID=35608 RepID=A0A2U1LY83_ARTAN|nr:zinc finger C2H2-type/integrase DNA-binding domain-containing protein [Artemisia annua]